VRNFDFSAPLFAFFPDKNHFGKSYLGQNERLNFRTFRRKARKNFRKSEKNCALNLNLAEFNRVLACNKRDKNFI
jgi:hypothetical protein